MKRIISALSVLAMVLSLSLTAFAQHKNTHINSGDLLSDILEIASTQIGYTHPDSGSKYDSAVSSPEENKSAAFICWCAAAAYISDEAIPHTGSAEELYSFFRQQSRLNTDNNYEPQRGDIIFLSDGEKITGCGIVTMADGDYVTAITGDDGGTVKKKMYTLSLKKIAGYGIPDYTLRATKTTDTYITTPLLLNFREKPTTSSEILDKIPKGTVIEIIKTENGWGNITYGENTGWISMDYAEKYDAIHLNSARYAVEWNVIDLSKFNGDVDFSKLKEQNIDGVILRIGFRGTKTKVIHQDEKFLEFYNSAKAQGLHIGCYFYSGAETIKEAAEEAEFIINTINKENLTFDMPVYWDMEDDIIARTGSDNINAITKEFLKIMEEQNIFSGVYTNTTWMEDYYNPAVFSGYALWVADWRGECQYKGDYGMWQYTEDGRLDGISEDVDLNKCYINYPLLITDKGYNTPPAPPSPREKGDVNGDGKINAADARLALRKSASLQSLSDTEFEAADYNSDGKVTAADARLILRTAAGISD